jgi:HemY protein
MRTEPDSARRLWLVLGKVTLVAILGVVAAMAWRQFTVTTRLASGSPARPDLAARPQILGELLTQAEKKAKSSGTRIEGLAELGRLYHANGFIAEAATCWRVLRSEQPREARWSYYLADLGRATSDHAAMTTLLQETLRRAPDYAPARLQLARLQFKSGQTADAERNYRLRLERLPQDPYSRLGLARVALQEGRTDQARAHLESVLKDTPHFSSAHNLYAEILAAAGDSAAADKHRWLGRETLRYREAEDPWLDELQAWCYDYERLCVLGTVELQTHQHARAQAYLERAIRVEPGRSNAYELLASVYLANHDASRARELLEQALPKITREKSPGFFVSLSLVYRQLKQPAEAIRIARLGLERAGPQAELLDALGQALAETGNHGEAVQAWRAALKQNPGDASLNFLLAKSYLALQQLDEAIEALDRSLTLQPRFLPTLLLRGEIELQAGHLEAAADYLGQAFDSHPEEPQARRLLAAWHLRSGIAAEAKQDPAAAERHYQAGLALEERHPDLLVRLGRFYVANARYAEAVRPLESYHHQQPDDAPGCLFLGQAYAATNQQQKAREILTRGVERAESSGNTTIAHHCRRILQQL